MGGSFDPFHLGHQAMVTQVLSIDYVEQLWLVPVGVAVHRQLSGFVDAMTRLTWVQKVYAHEPRVRVLDWEVLNSQPTSTLETLQRFRVTCPNQVPLLVLGEDSFNTLAQWHGYPKHKTLCNLCVFPRKGAEKKDLNGWVKATGSWHQKEGHILRMDVALPLISSTDIRWKATQRMSLRDLVDGCLEQEIEESYGGLN